MPCPSCPSVATETLVEHFNSISASKNSIPQDTEVYSLACEEMEDHLQEDLYKEFEVGEVANLVMSLPANKAHGPDGIRNEHIEEALFMIPHWTALFRACLSSGRIPPYWRDCSMSVIYKV